MTAKNKKLISDVLETTHEGIRLSVLWASAAAKAVGIHPTDLFAVAHLLGTGSATAGELMEVTGLTSGATTAMINRLKRARVVARKRNPKDARRVIVQLVRPPARVKFIRGVTDQELKDAFSAVDDEAMLHALSVQRQANEALKKAVIRFREESG